MPLETERKYLHPDLAELRKRLSMGQAAFISRTWEENLVLDTPEKSLRREKILLRLRQADTTTLTLKTPPNTAMPDNSGVKAMEELETTLADKTSLLAILERLGFEVAFKYEKLRETWQWQNCTICLDILPFMEAVELEGEPAAIDQTALQFGLHGLETSILNYHQLHQQYRQSRDLPPAEDFVFSTDQKARIMKDLDLSPDNT